MRNGNLVVTRISTSYYLPMGPKNQETFGTPEFEPLEWPEHEFSYSTYLSVVVTGLLSACFGSIYRWWLLTSGVLVTHHDVWSHMALPFEQWKTWTVDTILTKPERLDLELLTCLLPFHNGISFL